MAAKRTKGQITLFKPPVPRDPEILDVQATADTLGISKDAVYDLFKTNHVTTLFTSVRNEADRIRLT